jgi:[ribosomal protein S5]-alanine N-acetyltransferase
MSSTPRLTIEPLSTDHAGGLLAALDHPSVGEFIGGPDVTTLDALIDRIERVSLGPGEQYHPEQWHNFVVMLRDDRTIIGRVEASTYDDWAEIAYVFGPQWSGRGYATEAVEWLIASLHERGVDELWAAVHPDNAPSLRLLDRVGFRVVTDEPRRDLGSFDDGDVLLTRGPRATG